MNICTWNINGVRARADQILELLEAEKPDVVAFQELKAAPEQIPAHVRDLEGYSSFWHGAPGGYSGVSLHVRKESMPDVRFDHPPFDMETRIVTAETDTIVVASVYVPNGGKDYDAKLDFLGDLSAWSRAIIGNGRSLVLCGDLNVAMEEIDVHHSQRDEEAIGQRSDERELMKGLLQTGLVDVARHLHPDDDHFFTWWPYWKAARQRNLGWRIDYILATPDVVGPGAMCEVRRSFGTSDHAPVVASLTTAVRGR